MTRLRILRQARWQHQTALAPMVASATAAAIVVFVRAESRYGAMSDRTAAARRAIGRSVAHRRHALEITASALAVLAGVNASELSKLEHGKLARGVALAQKCDRVLTQIERERADRITARAS